ncbi:MAG: hypothetical protein ABIJ20_01030 [Nanoarchaeota archaeon]|nr:hypothetical protein [Nanoarchaeota archaeon]MBU1444739.1 hypothetical protein [Nanoarchaeota archaeon]MBU2406675.1 hypothetical protein [Nanoarchaeota archaeon]MBU2420765.1 hypothetical protein [Nanoarchaeota archaeon]MBU2475154.1 hypothetical protein [Nanoarchaeota archaeon]
MASISDLKKKVPKKGDKVGFWKKQLEDIKNNNIKTEIRQELLDALKEKGLVKLSLGEPAEYHITYDAFGHGLEPVYFWTLDFLRNQKPSGLGLTVNKIDEKFQASASSAYFGEMQGRATAMQNQAMAVLERVNNIVKTLINLIYDLKEFDVRLEAYNDLQSKESEKKKAGRMALKAIWMDNVDIKTGIGSINNLTRGELQFVTLRDAFFFANSLKQVKNLDLNERVKSILTRKIEEYSGWEKHSEIELRKRYEIEKAYLKAQVESLRLHTQWAKPYLRAAQQLGMNEFTTTEGLSSPDMISAFNTMQMQLTLFGKKEINPSSIHPSYKKVEFAKKLYACLEIDFHFRTVPQLAGRQGSSSQYIHTGTIDIWFRAYVFSEDELEEVERFESYKNMDLVESLTGVSLAELQEDLDRYLKPTKTEEEKEKIDYSSALPFFSALKGFGKIGGAMKLGAKGFNPMSNNAGNFRTSKVKKEAEKAALNYCLTTYSVFKKAHRMLTW